MNRRAFTLVELLSVIAIVGVLALILVPVVGSSRSMARNGQCQSNLRTLAQGAQLWIAEHRGQMPDAELWQAADGDYSLRSYLAISSDDNVRQQGVFTCPEAYRLHPAPETGLTDNLRTYSINLYACRTRNGEITSDVSHNAGILSALPNPTKTSFFMDGELMTATTSVRRYVHTGMADPGRPWTPDKPYGLLAVHNGKVTVVFIDGHVESIPAGEIPNSVSENGVTNAQKNPFWGRYPL